MQCLYDQRYVQYSPVLLGGKWYTYCEFMRNGVYFTAQPHRPITLWHISPGPAGRRRVKMSERDGCDDDEREIWDLGEIIFCKNYFDNLLKNYVLIWEMENEPFISWGSPSNGSAAGLASRCGISYCSPSIHFSQWDGHARRVQQTCTDIMVLKLILFQL